MQINKTTAWGQREFAPEVKHTSTNPARAGAASVRRNSQITPKQTENAQNIQDDETKDKAKNRNGQTDAQVLQYLEMLKNDRSNMEKQRQIQNDELKAMRIARNIMRGKKVPAKDESFLLSKNFKLYMAAKSAASIVGNTGTAKSELGNEGSSSGATSASVGGGAASALSGAIEASASVAGGAADSLSDAISASVGGGAPSDALGVSVSGRDVASIFGGNTNASNNKTFSSGLQKTEDYSTLFEGIKSDNGVTRGFAVSQSTSGSKKKKKRFHYNFKEISSRITSAKTSGNARQALSQAHQRTVSLRQELKSGRYDEEAVRIALLHAEAMERVAEKKMKHLEEEETAKKGGPCAGDIDDEVRNEQKMQDEQMLYEMQADRTTGDFSANSFYAGNSAASSFQADAAAFPTSSPVASGGNPLSADVMQLSFADMASDMEDLLNDFTELMDDTLEEVLNVNELAEELLSDGGKTEDPADLEEMKRKHRTEEQRAIAEADSKYLKAFFDKLQRERQAIASGAAQIAAAMNSGNGIVVGIPAAAKTSGTSSASRASEGSTDRTKDGDPPADISGGKGTPVTASIASGSGGMGASAAASGASGSVSAGAPAALFSASTVGTGTASSAPFADVSVSTGAPAAAGGTINISV